MDQEWESSCVLVPIQPHKRKAGQSIVIRMQRLVIPLIFQVNQIQNGNEEEVSEKCFQSKKKMSGKFEFCCSPIHFISHSPSMISTGKGNQKQFRKKIKSRWKMKKETIAPKVQ